MPQDHIRLMNDIIHRAIAKRDEEMKSTSTDGDGLILCSKLGKYFFFMHEEQEVEMKKIIFSQYMEQIVRGKKTELFFNISIFLNYPYDF